MKRQPTPPDEEHLPPDSTAEAEARQVAREEKEAAIESADKDSIDQIVLSNAFGKGGKIRVTRKGPLDNGYSYVCTIPADQWDTEITVEHIKKMFGGGDYKCQTFRSNGSMYKPFTFSIDSRFKGQLDEDEIKRLAGDGPKTNGSNDLMVKMMDLMKPKEDNLKLTDILAIMDKNSGKSDQTMLMLVTMMTKSMEVAQQNTTAMMTALATMFAGKQGNNNDALLLKLIEKERSPMAETLTMMAQVKDIFGNNDKPEKEEEDMWTKLGRIGSKVVEGVMAGRQPQPTPQVTAGAPPPAQIANEPKLGGLYSIMPPDYRAMFDSALRAAQKGSDPELYADLILDQADDQGLMILRQHLTPDDWCAKLFGDENAVAHIRPWLDQLRLMLLDDGTTTSHDGPAASGAPTAPTGPA